jgi:hypothetical protein
MPRRGWFLLGLLLLSAALRVELARRGGQYFFGDEGRYDRGVALYQALGRGDAAAIRAGFAWPEHALFAPLGAAVTAVQHLGAQLTRHGDWSRPENIGFTMWIGAAVLGLFSVANILLVHRLARATGAGEAEARWAAGLMAAANAPFYFSRHLLPYPCALCAALAGLAIGLREASRRRLLLAGALLGASYHLYNGYWHLVPAGALVLAWRWRGTPRNAWRSLAAAAVTGLLLGLGTPLLAGAALGGADYGRTLGAFSRSVTQGVFAEGWSLPWEYLWHSEGLAGVAVAICGAAAAALARRRGEAVPERVRLWLLALGGGYALLVLAANGLARFVVYGRTVLPFVAWGALLGGWALHALVRERRGWSAGVAAAVAGAAALQMLPHFTRTFPREFELEVLRRAGNPKHTVSFAGTIYQPLALPVTRPELLLVNAQFLYPLRHAITVPAGETLRQAEHPLSYPPFQYEGHTPRERALLRAAPVTMRLVRLADPAAVPDDLPPAWRFQDSDRPTGR